MMPIGERMKHNYEMPYSYHLTRRVPVIIRLDGKCFHTFTRGCKKPFDNQLSTAMVMTAIGMLHNIQGAKVAYTQSDEISILLTDYDTITTDAWFGYNVQKICSISASMCTSLFNTYYNLYKSADVLALFDSRVFNIPKEEVMNYFLWRQQDWIRNSVQMCAQHVYSQKQLNGVNIETQKEMLKSSVFNWDDLPLNWKYGTFVSKHRGVDHINQSHEAVLENKNMFDEYLNM